MATYHLHAGASTATLTLCVQQLVGSGVGDVNSRSYSRGPTSPLSVPQRECSRQMLCYMEFHIYGSGDL